MMHRVCPLAERETRTHVPEGLAAAPWVIRECEETGFVFLESPPGCEALNDELAWEQSFAKAVEARRTAQPARYALSTAVKRFRHRVLGRHKVAEMACAIVRRLDAPEVNRLDLGCGEGGLPGIVMDRLPTAQRQRCRDWRASLTASSNSS